MRSTLPSVRGVGPGAQVPDPEPREGVAKGAADLSPSVVRHDALDATDSLRDQPSGRPREKGQCGPLPFRGQELAVVRARMVGDRDVQVLWSIPRCVAAAPGRPSSGDRSWRSARAS